MLKPLIPASFEAEAKQSLENVGAVLKEAGMSPADAVSVQVLITDAALFDRMNAVYEAHFNDPKPTRTTVVVSKLVGRDMWRSPLPRGRSFRSLTPGKRTDRLASITPTKRELAPLHVPETRKNNRSLSLFQYLLQWTPQKVGSAPLASSSPERPSGVKPRRVRARRSD